MGQVFNLRVYLRHVANLPHEYLSPRSEHLRSMIETLLPPTAPALREHAPMSEIELLPRDEHNAQLIARTHPPDWQNPAPWPLYDLVVIGAGTAGLVSAAGTAGLGGKVALVERHLLGGDCLNYGCVPSKALIRAARVRALAEGRAHVAYEDIRHFAAEVLQHRVLLNYDGQAENVRLPNLVQECLQTLKEEG